MTDIKFSFVVPTIGRYSLYATLLSIFRNGVRETDEVLVVADGVSPEASSIVATFHKIGFSNLSYHEIKKSGGVGAAPRNYAIKRASGSHLLFMDDDDVYTFGAISRVREKALSAPEKIHIFRMRGQSKRIAYNVLWQEPRLQVGNIGTPMFMVPNRQGGLPVWPDGYAGDFGFISKAVEMFGGVGAVSWVDDVIAEIY